MLVEPAEPAPSETNVWDREFTWTLMNQLTSADDGSELRTFAYDDTGALMIQDGSLLSRDGEVLAEHGGGPETIFLNAWVTIVSQKIYKNINDGLDKIATKMDADASFETKSLYLHNDLVGSTNIVTDNHRSRVPAPRVLPVRGDLDQRPQGGDPHPVPVRRRLLRGALRDRPVRCPLVRHRT